MPIPQVTDRIKEAPAVVLRAVFAGIGQVLMAVDKIRAQMEQAASPAEPDQKAPGATEPAGRPDETSNVTVLRERTTATSTTAPRPAAAPAGAAAARTAAAAPKPATTPKPTTAPKPTAAKPATTPKPATAAKPATAKPATAKPTTTPKPATTPKSATAPKPATAAGQAAPETGSATPAAAKPAPPAAAAAQAAPIPGYADLSIASLRARLRGLDADGVRALLAYEQATTHRHDVITMFERRLSKIEDQAG
jgi:hypothetical protein